MSTILLPDGPPFDPVPPFNPGDPFDPDSPSPDPFDPGDPLDPTDPTDPFNPPPPFDEDDPPLPDFPPFLPPPDNPIEPFFIRPTPDGLGIEGGISIPFGRSITNTTDEESISKETNVNQIENIESSLVITGIDSDEGLITELSGAVIEVEPEDTDGDGIPDTEGKIGLDFNGDGEIDLEVKELDPDEDSLIDRVEVSLDTNFDGEYEIILGINEDFSSSNENDLVILGSSDDEINLEDGDDIAFANEGNDFLSGNAGNDFISGGAGDDSLNGGDNQDTIIGDEGRDIICGGLGNDFAFGGLGNDIAFGGLGNDFISGNEGDDFLSGNAGNDFLSGDEGNDFIFGSLGNDSLVGGEGDDTFRFEDITPGEMDTIIDFTPGEDKIRIASSDILFEEGGLIYNAETGILSYDPDRIANNGDETPFLQLSEDLDIDLDDFEFL